MVNEQQDDWHLFIEQACWGVRSSFNESTKHTPYEIMHLRKPRFPFELPEEEDPAPISLQEPTPNEVADYVSTKQEQLVAVEAKVCWKVILFVNVLSLPYVIDFNFLPQSTLQ